MKIAIFDIDNCLADDSHRVPLIDWQTDDLVKRYERYHSLCHEDKPGNVSEYERWSAQAERVAFLTARPHAVEVDTLSWLRKHIVRPQDTWTLLMRPEGCVDGSVALKRFQLERLLSSFAAAVKDVVVAIDDRDDVLEMYKAVGIKNVLKLEIHPNGKHGPTETEINPAVLLKRSAALFEARNVEYSDGYKRYGELLKALFPCSGIPQTKDSRDMARLNFLMMCLAKLQRYAHNFGSGGHKDSARDLQVYAAMLEEVTDGK